MLRYVITVCIAVLGAPAFAGRPSVVYDDVANIFNANPSEEAHCECTRTCDSKTETCPEVPVTLASPPSPPPGGNQIISPGAGNAILGSGATAPSPPPPPSGNGPIDCNEYCRNAIPPTEPPVAGSREPAGLP